MNVAMLKKLWKNEYFKTAIAIILMIGIVIGFWYGTQLALDTRYPLLAVASGSMCTEQHMYCDGWSHPFEPTLHVGDLIIVQGIDPEEIKADSYPHGDIIVFRRNDRPYVQEDLLIVHRAIAKEKRDDTIYFQTQGDGNARPDSKLVPGDHVVGKVILRVPWVGHIALFMNDFSGIFIIAFLLVILIIVEVVIPALSGEKAEGEQREDVEETFEEPKALGCWSGDISRALPFFVVRTLTSMKPLKPL